MAINRTKSWFGTSLYGSAPAPSEWAFAQEGGQISMFLSRGSGPHNYAGALYRVHKFTSNSSITFTEGGLVDVLIVAGGGQGGGANNGQMGGGGGAGGVLELYQHTVEAATYTITVGAGGYVASYDGQSGVNSSFGSYTAFGGGRGARGGLNNASGGGSGGGGSDNANAQGGNGTPSQGHDGGSTFGNFNQGGGGGGAGNGPASITSDVSLSDGGAGRLVCFDSDAGNYFGGGGAGGAAGSSDILGYGGLGGGGNGGTNDNNGQDAFYYGGGGGGASRNNSSNWNYGGSGYQGIVMVRYVVPTV